MKTNISLKIVLAVLFIAIAINPAFAGSKFGPRIPTAYVVTSGIGQSDDGIPPDPYETFSYDLALLDAGIEDFNVVYYTSVLPPESYSVPREIAERYYHHGAVLEAIMAKAGGVKGETIVAGVGRVWALNKDGKPVGGYAAEYERIYNCEYDETKARKEAEAQIAKSLNHELKIRNLTLDKTKPMDFEVAYLKITKNYGMAIAVLCFLDFIYPDPLPLPGK